MRPFHPFVLGVIEFFKIRHRFILFRFKICFRLSSSSMKSLAISGWWCVVSWRPLGSFITTTAINRIVA